MKTNKKLILLIIGIIIVVLGVILVIWFRQTRDTGTPRKITMGMDFSDTFSTPVLIAENQGFFQKEGLDVKIMEYPSGRTALSDMIKKGNLDIVTVAQTPIMYNSFSASNYAIIAGVAYSYENGVLMLARRDRGIKTAHDLKGKKIGTPIGSSGHFFLNLFLYYARLKMSDVEIIDIDAPNLPRMLDEGQVDAISVWQPQIYNAQKLLGEKAVILPSKNIYRVDFYLVANKEFLQNNPDSLKRLLKAITKAEDFIRQNKKESIDIVSSRLKLDKETVSAVWDNYQFEVFLDQAILTDLEAEARWAIENKYTNATKLPDYLNFIRTDILESVKPAAVNIIH